MALIYKIHPASDWAEAERAGRFTGAPVDLADGYIHFSNAAQATCGKMGTETGPNKARHHVAHISRAFDRGTQAETAASMHAIHFK
jgi:hypothetical protein